MASNYGYGRRKEFQVAEFLERRGFKLGRARASRGPVDLVAKRGTTHLAIQVKSTRKDSTEYTRLSQRQEVSLIRSAAPRKAKPALALVCRNYVFLLSVPDQGLMDKGESSLYVTIILGIREGNSLTDGHWATWRWRFRGPPILLDRRRQVVCRKHQCLSRVPFLGCPRTNRTVAEMEGSKMSRALGDD